MYSFFFFWLSNSEIDVKRRKEKKAHLSLYRFVSTATRNMQMYRMATTIPLYHINMKNYH